MILDIRMMLRDCSVQEMSRLVLMLTSSEGTRMRQLSYSALMALGQLPMACYLVGIDRSRLC